MCFPSLYFRHRLTGRCLVSNDYRETTSTSEPEARTTPPEVSRTDSPTTETGTDRTDIALGGAGKGNGNDGGSGTNIGAIAGGVVGGVVGLALIILGVWYAGTRYKAKGKEMRELGIGYVEGHNETRIN